MTNDTNPDYYRGGNIEAINIIEAYELDFCLGNALKYILRNGKKDASVLELKKARWYLTRRLEQLGEMPGHIIAEDKSQPFTEPDAFIDGFKAAYEYLGLRFKKCDDDRYG